MTELDVVITYLELDLTGVDDGAQGAAPLELERVPQATAAAVAADMYRDVGSAWHWTDRLPWTGADWDRAVNRTDVELWLARLDGIVAGYFELQVEREAIELRYFGLMPGFTGRGLGAALLAAAVARGRGIDRVRMTVNTCTLDHPAALPNYLRHGFIVTRTETRRRSIPS